MTMTTAVTTSSTERLSGAPERGRLAPCFAVVLLAFLYVLVATGNARADGGVPAPDQAASGALEATANVAGTGDSPIPLGGQTLDPGPGADQARPQQQAATDQAATSNAAAAQQQPRNVVISIRIDSPGDDGPITQANVAVAASDGSNNGSTTQSGAAGDGQPGDQRASTGQTASSTATASQDQAGNIVISVRINSPGNNGQITQSNTAVAVSIARNASVTNQGVPAQGVADRPGTADGAGNTARDPAPAIGPPAEQQQEQTSTPVAAGETPSTLIALPAPAAPRTAGLAAHPARKPVAAPASGTSPRTPRTPSTSPGHPAPSLAAAPPEQSAPATAARSGLRSVGSQANPAQRPAAVHGNAAARKDRGVRAIAADVLGRLAPRRALPAGERSKELSGAVLLTLIALLGALLVYAVSTYLPSGRRLLDPRGWRR